MTIKPYQSGLSSVGHFDFLDSEFEILTGGEIIVFDSVSVTLKDRAVADVYIPDGYRTILRLATGADTGPFFFADLDASSSFPAPGMEQTSLFASNQSFSYNLDSSGKVAIYGITGFYSLSSTVVDSDSITEDTLVNTPLYADPNGKLTTTISASEKVVAYFIEYKKGTILRAYHKPIQSLATHREGDSVIVYKVAI